MQGLAPSDIFVFEDFCLDRRGVLSRLDDSGNFAPVEIGSRALDILGVLIERAGEVVSKDEIVAAVWPATVVEDSNLTVQISALRRVLDRGRSNGSCIQTVARRGYRFVAELTPLAAERPSAVARVSPATSIFPPPGAAPRLSIVVLPFTNLSDDREQQYFADGITEDLTTDLSRIADMVVISRNTAFTYQGKRVDTKQVGRELGVRYVLEGSVRRSGNQVRVNAQLIDAETDAHLWAERFDGDTSDPFALQDLVTSRIANALGVELIAAEAARPIEHPDALDYIFGERAARLKPVSRDVFAEAISLFERALALDPHSIEAQSLLARTLMSRVLDGVSASAAADIARAEELAGQALAASRRYALAHYARGGVLRAQNRYQEAIPEYETAIALDRNFVGALVGIAQCKVYAGSIDEAIPLVEQAIRISPRDPVIYWWYQQIGKVHLLQSRINEAILWLEKARSATPAHPGICAELASAYALNGEIERAVAELAEARRLSRDDRYSNLAQLRAARYWGVLEVRALFEATYFAGLRLAGMPEE